MYGDICDGGYAGFFSPNRVVAEVEASFAGGSASDDSTHPKVEVTGCNKGI